MILYLEYICLVVAITYFVIALIIFRGLLKKYRRSEEKPKISILIPARNEEKYLPACLDSIAGITYPPHLTEVIILDDRSEDHTNEIAGQYCKKYSHFHSYTVRNDATGLSGKMNVLNQGIHHASGEIILVTDADCEVSPGWADALVSYFTAQTGMVGGITLLSKAQINEPIFFKIQALDWLFLQGVASGAAGSGFPTSILGNNFAFRKQAYLETGGFENIGFSLTEDMVLMQAIRRLKKWQIKYPLSSETEIFSQPAKSLNELLNQRRRWVSGGIIGPLSGWIMMITAFLAHFLPLIFFLLAKPTLLIYVSLLLPIVSDLFFILRPLARRIKKTDLLRYFTFFEIYYFFYTTIFTFLSLLPLKITWKSRRF